MLLDRGLPLPQRAALRGGALGPEVTALYARARLELGRVYWRAMDFDQAASLAAAARAAAPSDDATFLLALALALRSGPEDAADMMRKAPHTFTSAETPALDLLARQPGRLAGLSGFDAALVHQLAAPENAGPAYWNDVARRFQAAAAVLTDPAQRAAAEARARASEALARAVADLEPTGKPGAKK